MSNALRKHARRHQNGGLDALDMTKLQHGNEAHSPDMFSGFHYLTTYFAPAEVAVGTEEKVIDTYSFTVPKKTRYILMPFYQCTYRWSRAGTQTASLRWYADGVQRTADIPVYAPDTDTRPLFISVPARDIWDMMFWADGFTEGEHTIELRGLTTALTVYIANRCMMLMALTRKEV